MTRLTPLTTGALIRELRLTDAPVSPEARTAAARAVIPVLTDEQYGRIAQRDQRDRIQILMDSAAIKVNAASIDVYGPGARLLHRDGEQRSAPGTVPHSCPRCGTEARGRTEDERVNWYSAHYNRAHGGHR
jgi:hypothetical protein